MASGLYCENEDIHHLNHNIFQVVIKKVQVNGANPIKIVGHIYAVLNLKHSEIGCLNCLNQWQCLKQAEYNVM